MDCGGCEERKKKLIAWAEENGHTTVAKVARKLPTPRSRRRREPPPGTVLRAKKED